MKRKGYDKSFDKKNLTTKDAVQKEEVKIKLKRSLKERKKKLPMNIVEFVIGVVLLGFCWSYIQSHPAEKSSLFSGLEVITEKAKVRFSQWTTGKGPELQNQFQLEKTFEEIISLAESSPECLSDNEMASINRAVSKLEALPIEEFVEQERAFTTVANLYYTKINEECLIN